MGLWMEVLIVGAAAGLAVRAWYARRRQAGAPARRRAERPNPHYSSQGLRNQLDRERWGAIDLDTLHPLNRAEVERLLGAVDRRGISALTAKDRLFLDNMSLKRSD